jgi:hypothetical protein
MPVYHQIGHHSENLLREPELGAYRGAILSPVNYVMQDVIAQVAAAPDGFDTIFDPQFYYPNSERGHLREWPYFSNEVDTQDLASTEWWRATVESIVGACDLIGATAICSPAPVPRVYTDEYFVRLVEVGGLLCDQLEGRSIRPLQTAIIGLDDVATRGRPQTIASILTATQCQQIYLIFVGNVEPRRELADPETLKGAMRLIAALRQAKMRVLVGFCSSDVLLWKAAGADSVATGKFFNLRRFTSARFEEPSQGGGQLPYWCEESLVAFLRESDIIRVQAQNMLSDSSQRNPFAQRILQRAPGAPWVALGWRQFMWWFADIEARIDQGTASVRDLLRDAENRWLDLENVDVLMEEPRNNGSWVRPWRRALAEYPTF